MSPRFIQPPPRKTPGSTTGMFSLNYTLPSKDTTSLLGRYPGKQLHFFNEGTVVFEDALVVVAGNFESTGSTSMNNPGFLDTGNIVVGGDVTGNFDFGGDAENQLSAVNPGATVDLTPSDSYGTSIPWWVGFFFPDSKSEI